MKKTKERVAKREWHAVEGDVLNPDRKWGIVQYMTLEDCQLIDGDDATYPSRTVVVAEVTEADDPDQTRNDAILLAAAPDLLAACERLLGCVTLDSDMEEDFAPEIQQARAAVARARS